MKKFRIVALLVAIVLVLSGCSLVRVDEERAMNRVVARVNGTEIYRYEINDSEVESTASSMIDMYTQLGMEISDEEEQEMLADYLEIALDGLVMSEVLMQKAVELDITLTDEEKQEYRDEADTQFESQKTNIRYQVELEVYQAMLEEEAAAEDTDTDDTDAAADDTAEDTVADDTTEDTEDDTDVDTEDSDTTDDADTDAADAVDDTDAADDTTEDDADSDAADDTADDTDTDTTDDADAVDDTDTNTEDDTDAVDDTDTDTEDDTEEDSLFTDEQEAYIEQETEARYQEFLESYEYTPDSLYEYLCEQAIVEKVTEYTHGFASVSDEEVQTWYNDTLALQQEQMDADPEEFANVIEGGYIYTYVPEDTVAVKQILLAFDDELTDEAQALYDEGDTDGMLALVQDAVDDLMPTVEDIRQQLIGGGDIDALIEEYNDDPGMKELPGSKVGYLVEERTSKYLSAFSEAALSLMELGAVSEPVVTYNGIHILQSINIYKAGTISLDDIFDEIKEAMLPGKQQEKYDEMSQQWLEEADVKYYRNNLTF